MKIKIYHSAINKLADEKLIKELAGRDKTKTHIIITPDKMSLHFEKKLYSLLGEEAFFDVYTTTLSRFANKVNGGNGRILTKQGGVLIVKKILNEYSHQLKSFGADCNAVGFASVLYDTICMFKSSNVPFDEIGECKNKFLTGKLNDIKFVYEKYENYLKNDYTDSFNRLSLCAKNITREDFKDTYVYFVGFDDFTKQTYYIIEKLMMCSAGVSVSTSYAKKSDKKHNANIYTNTIFYNVIDVAKNIGCEIEYIACDEHFDLMEKNHMLNELFGYKLFGFNGNNNFVKLFSYKNVEDEIKNTVQNIKYRIINEGLRFKDFAIVVPSLSSYKPMLLKYLNEFGVNYFLDEVVKLKETMLSRHVIDYITYAIMPNKYSALALLKSKFTDIDYGEIEKFENYIESFNIPNYSLHTYSQNNAISDFLTQCHGFMSKSHKKMTINKHIENVNSYILNEKFLLRYEEVLKRYYINQDLFNYRALKQAYERISNIFSEFQTIGEYECDLQEFLQFLKLYFDNVSITIPPVVNDAVFVTEFSGAIIDDVDYVFLLGSSEGATPSYVIDAGLISDSEIDLMPKSFKISPSVSLINKRIKFKAFELLFSAKKQLVVSYATRNDSGDCFASSIMENLKNIFCLQILNGSNMLDIQQNILHGNFDNLIYNTFNKPSAERKFIEMLKYYDSFAENANYLDALSKINAVLESGAIEKLGYKNIPQNINVKNLPSTIGISEIEKFCSCPYQHFCDYILRLTELDKTEIDGIAVGNILHDFLKDIVFHLDEPDNFATEFFDRIMTREQYKVFGSNPKNNYIIKELRQEALRIFGVLKRQQELSGFKIKETELPFKTKNPILAVGNVNVHLTGKIDRVDYSSDGFRIIDYKTGMVDFSDYNGIVYGNKMQVVVYMSLLFDNNSNIKPLGALYFPISNDFSSSSQEELYKMQGIAEKSIKNLLNFDKNLNSENYSSNIVDLKTGKDGKIKSEKYYKNMCLSENEIKSLSEFVIDKVKESIDKIFNGVILPSPISEDVQCKYCKYKGLCNFSKYYFNSERKDKNYFSISDFCEGGE